MDQSFTIIDFLNSEFQTKENPFFLITSDQFLELENLDFLSTQENKISYIKINYNNLNDFFPEDYLFKMNYILFIYLVVVFFIWLFMSIIYRRFFNILHKWFTGILILKVFYTLIVIFNLQIIFQKVTEDEEMMLEFIKIFYETVLVTFNCVFKSFFLFLLVLIFEVKIIFNLGL